MHLYSLIVIYLKKIDSLIEKCVRDSQLAGGGGDGDDGDSGLSMIEINKEILALTVNEEEQGEEQLKIVNGFTLAVVVDRSEQVGDTYRRYATATNSKGIVILKGELNKYNRDKGTYGNGDGKDASHKGGKIVGFESEKKNRGRAEKSRLKKKK